MAISKKLRYQVFERDSFTCQYCGRKPPIVILEVDHIIPKSKGGTDEPSNLITSCRDCNRGKSAIVPIEKLKEIKRLEAERQRQREAYDKFIKRKKQKIRKDLAELNNLWSELCDDQFMLNENGLRSLRRFLVFFTKEEIKKAIKIASEEIVLGENPQKDIEDRFRYMCGILHNWRREKQNPLLYELIRYWKTMSIKKHRGIGFYKEKSLIEALSRYSMEEIKRAMDIALSERRNSYFRAFCELLGITY